MTDSSLPSLVPVVIQTCFPSTTGDDQPRSWTGVFQTTFLVSLHSTGLPREWSETKNVVWKTPVHDRGWSSPVVLGKQVWMTTGTKDGKELSVICVDRETGKILVDHKLFHIAKPDELWSKYNSYASPTPVIEEGHVYVHFGCYGTACLDTKAGKVLWAREDLLCNHWRGAGSSPIVHENLLILTFDGY